MGRDLDRVEERRQLTKKELEGGLAKDADSIARFKQYDYKAVSIYPVHKVLSLWRCGRHFWLCICVVKRWLLQTVRLRPWRRACGSSRQCRWDDETKSSPQRYTAIFFQILLLAFVLFVCGPL